MNTEKLRKVDVGEHFFKEWGNLFITWYDTTGIYNLNPEVIAEISLREIEVPPFYQYIGFDVRIIHKKNGELANHLFLFDEQHPHTCYFSDGLGCFL